MSFSSGFRGRGKKAETRLVLLTNDVWVKSFRKKRGEGVKLRRRGQFFAARQEEGSNLS
jgi:hypothetical protein